jgi:hypothetical protein
VRTLPKAQPIDRRAFGLPASGFYVLAIALSAAFFFIVGELLLESADAPYLTAGIAATAMLCALVVLREVIVRRRRRRLFSGRFPSVSPIGTRGRAPGNADKLSIEQNAAVLREIKIKSDAAKVLNKLSGAHREVFELCSAYAARVETELKTVGPGSPRLAPLLRGRTAAGEFHRYHLFKWAEVETHGLTEAARSRPEIGERIESAQKAVHVIEQALAHYPAEPHLLESRDVLDELVVSIKVANLIERAEHAVFDNDDSEARSRYSEALYLLKGDGPKESRHRAIAHVESELAKIR